MKREDCEKKQTTGLFGRPVQVIVRECRPEGRSKTTDGRICETGFNLGVKQWGSYE